MLYAHPSNESEKKSQKNDSMKETLIGRMTAISSENSCLMMEHMKSIYQNENAAQIEQIRRQFPTYLIFFCTYTNK